MALRRAVGGRRVNLRGCFNFRDVGGYQAGAEGTTRRRRLYRSDGLHRLTPADQKEFLGLGLATVVDLRTAEEVAQHGRARTVSTIHQLPIAEVLPSPPGAQGCHAEAAAVADVYAATLAASCETMRSVLAMLADPHAYPLVLCCSTGVDRTGMVTAVVLGLLGVADDVIVGDYAASREAILRQTGRLRFEHPRAVSHAVDRYGAGLLGVVPEAMGRFLGLIRKEHGCFSGYAASIDMAGSLPHLRAALLDPLE